MLENSLRLSKISPRYKRKLIAIKDSLKPRLPLLGWLLILIIVAKLISAGIDYYQNKGLTWTFLNAFIKYRPAEIIKSYNGRTNILLLGVPGGSYPGKKLSDTMIFSSFSLSEDDVLMLSLPRDIWSPTLKDKINSAYYYGEEKKTGSGFVLSKSIAEEVLGDPIHYAVLIDFDGFKKLIDLVGEIEVDVPESFTDKKFPIPGEENADCDGDIDYQCRYETVKFEKGIQRMNGDTALKYVRSRNAEGKQGTDFARSQRQRQVILAFKDKITNLQILTNPGKIKMIYEQFKKTVKTDCSIQELLIIGRIALRIKPDSTRNLVLDTGDEKKGEAGWLYNPPNSKFGRWVLYPIGDSFKLIHKLVDCHLQSPNCSMKPEDY